MAPPDDVPDNELPLLSGAVGGGGGGGMDIEELTGASIASSGAGVAASECPCNNLVLLRLICINVWTPPRHPHSGSVNFLYL